MSSALHTRLGPRALAACVGFVALVMACNGLLGVEDGVLATDAGTSASGEAGSDGTLANEAGNDAGDAGVDGPTLILTSVAPSRGPSTGVDPLGGGPVVLTITGSGFAPGAAVTIAGAQASAADAGAGADKSTTLAVQLPKSPGPLGPVPVVVANPDGTMVVAPNLFAYYATTATLAPDTVITVNTDTTGYEVEALLAADLRDAGVLDLVVSVTGTTSYDNGTAVSLGAGDGGFGPPQFLSLPGYVDVLATGDFDHDGTVDLAYAALSGTTVGVELGDGGGGFSVGSQYSETGRFSAVAVGHFAGTPFQDLLISGYAGGGDLLTILPGVGDGTFQPGVLASPPLGFVGGMRAGDLNGDGVPDAVVVNQAPDAGGLSLMTGMLGLADGGLGPPSAASVGSIGYEVALADFNGDGNLDAVTGCNLTLSANVVFGDGKGGFTGTVPVQWGFAGPHVGLVVGDFNGDHTKDIAVLDLNWNVSLLLNDGSGRFKASPVVNACTLFTAADAGFSCDQTQRLLAADFNRDGLDDLAIGGGSSSGYPPAYVAILLAQHP